MANFNELEFSNEHRTLANSFSAQMKSFNQSAKFYGKSISCNSKHRQSYGLNLFCLRCSDNWHPASLARGRQLFCTYKSFYNSLAAVLNVRIDSLEIFTNHLCALCPSLPQSTTLLFWLNIKQRRIVSTDNLLCMKANALLPAQKANRLTIKGRRGGVSLMPGPTIAQIKIWLPAILLCQMKFIAFLNQGMNRQ